MNASGNLAIAGTELSAAKVQAASLTTELDTVKAELQACSSKKPKKK
jgi:hypothetical protein